LAISGPILGDWPDWRRRGAENGRTAWGTDRWIAEWRHSPDRRARCEIKGYSITLYQIEGGNLSTTTIQLQDF
jgi:hypothetical protein